jgi:hypothetical protein
MILEVGVGSDIFQYPYQDLQHLASPSLVKTTWESISEFKLVLKHDIEIPLPRTNDIPLMQLFCNNGARGSLLATLNRCRLFLKAFHLSDITDFSGKYITDMVWQGTSSSFVTNNFTWPQQGKPSTAAWHIWREFLSQNLTVWHRNLRSPLGPWITSDDWNWFLNLEDERLYEKRGDEWW